MVKVTKVKARSYISKLKGNILTGFFCVPKGETDIRVVYVTTKCGLNQAVWAPNIYLPTVESVLRLIDLSTWSGDLDLVNFFLNHLLEARLRCYVGIDVTALDQERREDGKRMWETWKRMLMGFRASVYICTWTYPRYIKQSTPM